MQVQPQRRGVPVHVREGAADAVLAAQAGQPQPLRQDRVLPHARDVRVALVSGQHARQDRTGDLLLAGSVRRSVGQRTVPHPFFPQPAHLQKLDEISDRTVRCNFGIRFPLYMQRTAEGVYPVRRRQTRQPLKFFTLRVSHFPASSLRHVPHYARLSRHMHHWRRVQLPFLELWNAISRSVHWRVRRK